MQLPMSRDSGKLTPREIRICTYISGQMSLTRFAPSLLKHIFGEKVIHIFWDMKARLSDKQLPSCGV